MGTFSDVFDDLCPRGNKAVSGLFYPFLNVRTAHHPASRSRPR